MPPEPSAPERPAVPTWAARLVVGALFAALAGATLTPRVADSLPVRDAVWGAVLLCALWALFLGLRRPPLTAEIVVRSPHWVQILMHSAIFVYWGAHVELVRDIAPLILLQIPLAYLVDMLVAWSRGRRWQLGFGPVPVIGSINLFLWFKDPWFALQLVMVALAFLGRAFVQWERGGRRRHIFNPSGLALTAVSIGVIVFGSTTDMTWGREVATTLRVAPYMFELIFAVGLLVQLLFRVTWTTFGAAAAAWLVCAVWFQATGDWFFGDTTIPIAVFLGMNLLITDPATSPDNAPGKALFGALYGVLVFPLFVLLPAIGQPAFYDKLLQVPLCNALAPKLERLGARIAALGARLKWSPGAWNTVAVAAWCGVFLLMRPGLVDHPGADPETWRAACAGGDPAACVQLKHTLEKGCGLGRPAVCHQLALSLSDPGALDRDLDRAASLMRDACAAGHAPSCEAQPAAPTRLATPGADPRAAVATFRAACDAGQAAGCANLGLMLLRGDGVPPDPAAALALHERACQLGSAVACGRLGVLHARGVHGRPDLNKARAAFEKGCRGGDEASCRRIAAEPR